MQNRGSAFIEVIVVFPIVLMFFGMITEYGFALNRHLVLTRAVHEGTLRGAFVPNLAPGIQISSKAQLNAYFTNGVLGHLSGGHNHIQERVLDTLNIYRRLLPSYWVPLESLTTEVTINPATTERNIRIVVEGVPTSLTGLNRLFPWLNIRLRVSGSSGGGFADT